MDIAPGQMTCRSRNPRRRTVAHHTRRFGGRSRGLSLVELMISLMLGAFVTAGVIQLFVANSATHTLLVGQSRMQESARFALEFLGRAIRTAGYKGCYSGVDRLYSVPDAITSPAGTNINYEFNILTAIEGYDGVGGGWLPLIGGSVPNSSPTADADVHVLNTSGFGAGNGVDHQIVQLGTDIITLRSVSANGYLLNADMGSLTAPVVLVDPDPAQALEFADDHLVVISDCAKSTVFRVTGEPTRGGGTISVAHTRGDFDVPLNEVAEIHERERYFAEDAELAAIETNTFFIAPSEGFNNDGKPVLSLWRKTSLNVPVELVEGVEDLQVLYGVDQTGDGTPNHYVGAQDIGGNAVVTIRAAVVVNSVDNVGATVLPTQGCTITKRDSDGNLEDIDVCLDGAAYDGLLRRSFSQTVKLRN